METLQERKAKTAFKATEMKYHHGTKSFRGVATDKGFAENLRRNIGEIALIEEYEIITLFSNVNECERFKEFADTSLNLFEFVDIWNYEVDLDSLLPIEAVDYLEWVHICGRKPEFVVSYKKRDGYYLVNGEIYG